MENAKKSGRVSESAVERLVMLGYKCHSCGVVVDKNELKHDADAMSGVECFECCPHCGVWLSEDDITQQITK